MAARRIAETDSLQDSTSEAAHPLDALEEWRSVSGIGNGNSSSAATPSFAKAHIASIQSSGDSSTIMAATEWPQVPFFSSKLPTFMTHSTGSNGAGCVSSGSKTAAPHSAARRLDFISSDGGATHRRENSFGAANLLDARGAAAASAASARLLRLTEPRTTSSSLAAARSAAARPP